MNADQVVELMLSSKSEDEWNQNCDKVKAEFGGNYPDFWFAKIIIGGIFQDAKANHNW